MDDQPAGMANHGDGLTMYEEYRGFAASDDPNGKPVVIRTDPLRKDIFLRLTGPDPALYVRGVAMFLAAASRDNKTFAVHYIVSSNTLENIAGLDETPENLPRWLDFNAHMGPSKGRGWQGEGDFGQEQAAVNIVGKALPPDLNGNPPPGNTKPIPTMPVQRGVGADRHAGYTDPIDITAVRVSRANCELMVTNLTNAVLDAGMEMDHQALRQNPAGPNYRRSLEDADRALAAQGVNIDMVKAGLAAKAPAMKEQLVQELIVFTVMHELGHAAGARHHQIDAPNGNNGAGLATCPMQYWNFQHPDNIVKFIAFVFDPSTGSADGKPYHFCESNDNDFPGMRLHQRESERWSATATDSN